MGPFGKDKDKNPAASIATPADNSPAQKIDNALNDLVKESENADKIDESLDAVTSREERNRMAREKYDKYEEKLQKLQNAVDEARAKVPGSSMTALLDKMIAEMQAKIDEGRGSLLGSPFKWIKDHVQDMQHAWKGIVGTNEWKLFSKPEPPKPLTNEQAEKLEEKEQSAAKTP